ncbi:hypothetical protein [Paenibacillus mendelii]|uniref:Uncharacterized protein n=1 Tax=Paenibacillus mendelii TaxID=206163 RepID=A0ABV6J7F5_9BACL|nr:hypothetical protein [Paenibacillus mendelii]MCQ6562164.1 hypothetical protein [Paenibacillus mendelii]
MMGKTDTKMLDTDILIAGGGMTGVAHWLRLATEPGSFYARTVPFLAETHRRRFA